MRIVVLDSSSIGHDAAVAALSGLGELSMHGISPRATVIERLAGADIAVTNRVRFDAALLKALPDLKLIALTATGYDGVDIEAMRQLGKALCNVPGYSTESVAQHTLSLALALASRVPLLDAMSKAGVTRTDDALPLLDESFLEISSATWGIIGLGSIGKRVASLAEALGARVVYFSTSGRHDEPGFARRGLPELLTESDIVSIHCPLNDSTRGLIGARELTLMKPRSFLINAGRGGIVDEAALADALERKRIAGAALDVLAREPLEEGSPLRAQAIADRLILSPHVAWASRESRARLLAETALNIEAFIAGGRRNRVI
jgi:glycerate dehydrogenase